MTATPDPFELLHEQPDLPALELPAELAAAYGGTLGFPARRLFVNFVSSVDGVVAIPGDGRAPQLIAGQSDADRFVMALLRACADVILVGAGTVRDAPGARWTPEQIYPPAAALFDELRRRRGGTARPALALVSASGRVEREQLERVDPTFVFTTDEGAERLEGLPSSIRVRSLGRDLQLDLGAAIETLHEAGLEQILCEGGPRLFGSLVAAGLADELFLTLSPVLAGRDLDPRLSLLEGAQLLPDRSVVGDLVSVRRQGSHLFLRYRLPHV